MLQALKEEEKDIFFLHNDRVVEIYLFLYRPEKLIYKKILHWKEINFAHKYNLFETFFNKIIKLR